MDTEEIAKYALGILLLLFIIVSILRLSILISPPKKLDPNFTSRSLTGWTNTPKKLAWSKLIEETSSDKKTG